VRNNRQREVWFTLERESNDKSTRTPVATYNLWTEAWKDGQELEGGGSHPRITRHSV
jgi:hypothetical protein